MWRNTLASAVIGCAALAFSISAALPAGTSARPPVPVPSALSHSTFVTEKTAAQLYAWGPGSNDPGNCAPNPGELSLSPGWVQLSTTGVTGDCTDIESPHMYPAKAGYVYESRVFISNLYQWGSYWMYGDRWPAGGEIDAYEANFDQNGVSYHFSGGDVTTFFNGALTEFSDNLSRFPGWVTIDIAYGEHEISVYYDGNLFARVAGPYVQNSEQWISWGTGSCNDFGDNLCAAGGQKAGFIRVAWLKVFD
jgi:hypothetical protein